MAYSNDVTVVVATPVAELLAALDGALTESQLYGDLSARIDLIDAPSTGLVSKTTVLESASSSQATSINTLVSTVGDHSTSISTQSSSIDGLEGKYTVKIDNNGHVTGYGLASTTNTGTPTSEFMVVADKFSIAPVATSATAADGSPFYYLTTPTVVNGVTVPVGAYMKKAHISAASVDTLEIKGNAVTIPVTAYTGSSVEVAATPTATVIQSASITVDGATPIAVFVSCATQNNANQSMVMSITRGSTVLRDLMCGPDSPYNNTGAFSFSLSDTPTAGTHTYSLSAYIIDSSAVGGAFSRGITLIGAKR
jgi:uncharacterized protein YoxC